MTHILIATLALGDAVEALQHATATILSTGVVGACLVALSTWYIIKDRKYEKRVDEMLAREREFQREQSQAAEKYRLAMENVAKTLDIVVSMVKDR
jgi:hypothetical protein